jgi:hypothetical protein
MTEIRAEDLQTIESPLGIVYALTFVCRVCGDRDFCHPDLCTEVCDRCTEKQRHGN